MNEGRRSYPSLSIPANMDSELGPGMLEDLDFTALRNGIPSLGESRSTEASGEYIMGLTELDRGVLLEAFGPELLLPSMLDAEDPNSALLHNPGLSPVPSLAATSSSTTEGRKQTARSIPVPSKTKQFFHPQYLGNSSFTQLANNSITLQPSSQPNSYGSSGSAFLSSVLNPTTPGTSLGSQPGGQQQQHFQQHHQQQHYPFFSHTPPTASSYEVSHFGKRPRSSSVSGKLRSASEYLEEKGLLDRQTKGILNDLFIIGDLEMQNALDQYEAGDPSALEKMIQSGALLNRLPKDIDILGGLDFDFLTVHDGVHDMAELEDLQQSTSSIPQDPSLNITAQNLNTKILPTHTQEALMDQNSPPPHMVSPPRQNQYSGDTHDDDGIGELDFAGDFVSDHQYINDVLHQFNHQPTHAAPSPAPPQSYGSSVADSTDDDEGHGFHEYDRRNRSNSLFSALLNEPQYQTTTTTTIPQRQRSETLASQQSEATRNTAAVQYGEWMEGSPPSMAPARATNNRGISVRRNSSTTKPTSSGLTASLEAEKKRVEREQKKKEKEDKRLEQREKKERKQQLLLQRKAKQQEQDDNNNNEEEEEDDDERNNEGLQEHASGCGRPRPDLIQDDENGVRHRPDGWIGAYSPESRRIRLERFLEKRKHRVWTQSVKYGVRKNFADSRLRVKGRFVKKEDELLMRELMSMT